MNANQEICVICKKETVENDEVVKIRKKGADGFNSASDQRGDNIVVAAGDTVHKTCRRDFINKKDIEIDKKAKLDSAPAVKKVCVSLLARTIAKKTAYSVGTRL